MTLSKEAIMVILEEREKKFPHPRTQMERYPEGRNCSDYEFDLDQHYWFKDYKKQILRLLDRGAVAEAEQALLFDTVFGPGRNGAIMEPKNRAIKLLLEATY